ncbi:hypothetical protein ACQY0O_001698 [Thecaphora frezii]
MMRPGAVRTLLALLLVGLAYTAPSAQSQSQPSLLALSRLGQGSTPVQSQQVFTLDRSATSDSADYDDAVEDRGHRQHGKIFLIRHGEKGKHHRIGLSRKGKKRAKCIEKMFSSKPKLKVDCILTQDYRASGKRKRPYLTVKPLAEKLGLPIDHSCDRDDPNCAARIALEQSSQGRNVIICWEHRKLTEIAKALGVRGVKPPGKRFDILYTLEPSHNLHGRKFQLGSVVSEQCHGLDSRYKHWKPGKHIGGGIGDDAAWHAEEQEQADDDDGDFDEGDGHDDPDEYGDGDGEEED